jgi:penicillin-binding protein 1C
MVNQDGLIVSENCKTTTIIKDTIFVLPSYMEYYYKNANMNYKGLPAQDPSCHSASSACKIIYPYDGLKIFLPKESTDKQNDLIAKAYHREKGAKLYWFLDEDYKTETKISPHDCLLKISIGKHTLTITDQWGNKDEISFEILGNE